MPKQGTEIVISAPSGFRHISGITWNADEGFQTSGQIPPEWVRLFSNTSGKNREKNEGKTTNSRNSQTTNSRNSQTTNSRNSNSQNVNSQNANSQTTSYPHTSPQSPSITYQPPANHVPPGEPTNSQSTNYQSTNHQSTNYPSTNNQSTNYQSTNYQPTNYPSPDYPSTNYQSTNYQTSSYEPAPYQSPPPINPDYGTPQPSAPPIEDRAMLFNGEWRILIAREKFTKQDRYSSCVLNPTHFPVEYNLLAAYLSPLKSMVSSKIELIHNKHQIRLFHGTIQELEARTKDETFQPHFDKESSRGTREKILADLVSHPANAQHNRGVQIVRAWHGTNLVKAKKILNAGFSNLATLDEGWYGKGIYFTTNPEYASRYCQKAPDSCLLMCYVIVFNPFPVVLDDTTPHMRFLNKANYNNFGCHFVPVVKYGKMDYRPPQNNYSGDYDEIVIFNEHHVLPYAIVELNKLPKGLVREESVVHASALLNVSAKEAENQSHPILCYAVATAEFTSAEYPGQYLKIEVGTVVSVVEYGLDGWWLGYKLYSPDTLGYFPSNHVVKMNDEQVKQLKTGKK